MYPNPGFNQYTGTFSHYGPPTPGHDTPNPSTPSVRDSRSTDQTDSSNHTSWTSLSSSRPNSDSTSKVPCTACWQSKEKGSLAVHYRKCPAIIKDGMDLWACAICPHAPYYNRDAYINHLLTHNPNHGGVPVFDHVSTPYLSVGMWITVHYKSAIKRQISNLFHGLVWRDPSLVERWQSINSDALLPLYYNFDASIALEVSRTLQSPSGRAASIVFEQFRKLQDPLPSTPASAAWSSGHATTQAVVPSTAARNPQDMISRLGVDEPLAQMSATRVPQPFSQPNGVFTQTPMQYTSGPGHQSMDMYPPPASYSPAGLGIYSQSQYSSLPHTSSSQHDTRWDTRYYAYGRDRNDSMQQQSLSPMSSLPTDPPIYEQSDLKINFNALNADIANCSDPVRPANSSQPVQASLGDAFGQPQHRPIYHDPQAPHQSQQDNAPPVHQLDGWSAPQSQQSPSVSDQEQRWLQSAGQEAQNRRQTNMVHPGQHYGQGDNTLSSFMDI
ncbi:hypothetical protein B0A48_04654 [Cryoendolithus antarcticus]|uniref:Uncharacterized protein n=1 Tax=Cryoendolithus antarcticus TaxID=1507870 RepID=A0A1V8TFY5_9PEZI|nr:hypothetical protein B0A48_04654 [Cryoendolithus antarcticus]